MHTVPRPKSIDLTPWYKDRNDEQGYDPPTKRPEQLPRRVPKQRRGTPSPELHRIALRQAARMVVRRKELMEYAEFLTGELNVPLSRLYFMALAGFFEKYDENLKTNGDAPQAAGSYWEPSIRNEEELNAILEADRLTPELAER